MVVDVVQKCLFISTFSLTIIYETLASVRPYKHKTPLLSASGDRWSVDVMKEGMPAVVSQKEQGFDMNNEEIRKFKLWPNAIVPYYIDDFSYDKVLRDRIRNFLDVSSTLTGLVFRELPSAPEDDKTRWVFFINRISLMGCQDHSPTHFTNEGVQKVTLGYNCLSEGGELAEAVLAIAGVPAQHNSPDRDKYIKVNMDNILPGKQYLYKKVQDNEWLFHELEYDFLSASHFSYHKHTKNGQATIEPLNQVEVQVGENNGFSYSDILKIRMLYDFMAKTKLSKMKAPECNKMFKPVKSKLHGVSRPKDKIEPRVKPYQYLGIAPPEYLWNSTKKQNVKKYGSDANIENETNANKKTNLKGRGSRVLSPLSLLSDYDTDEGNRNSQKIKNKLKINK